MRTSGGGGGKSSGGGGIADKSGGGGGAEKSGGGGGGDGVECRECASPEPLIERFMMTTQVAVDWRVSVMEPFKAAA